MSTKLSQKPHLFPLAKWLGPFPGRDGSVGERACICFKPLGCECVSGKQSLGPRSHGHNIGVYLVRRVSETEGDLVDPVIRGILIRTSVR